MQVKNVWNIITGTTIVVTVLVGFITTKFMETYKEIYTIEISKLRNEIKEFRQYQADKLHPHVVDVTMYQPVYPQTDRTPHITADGTRFNTGQASRYRFVALSRNLLARWGGPFQYGDYIVIKGTPNKDGIYQVRDTMNPKFTNVVDILESTNVRPYKYNNVKLYKLTIDNRRDV
tara:strand:+ start:451 stop:975 length:525 start_codon:yes stop_codon:yes gene_type:complete